MAGLAAARELADAGRRVCVLEARDRIGGRIHTDRTRDSPVELGAGWIHGAEGNPVAALAERFGSGLSRARHEDFALYDGTGRRTGDEEFTARQARFAELLAAAKAEARRADRPLAEAVWAAADREGASARTAARWGLRWLGLIMGTDAASLSARSWDQDVDLPGADRVITRGYDVVPRGLARGLDVRCGEIVQRVEWSAGGVRAHTKRQVLEAEASVVTLPLGVLQRAPDLFDPPLPESKRAVVAGMGMGVLDKVVLRFPGAFWPDGCEHLALAEAGPDDVGAFSNLVHHGGGPVLVGWMAGAQARAFEACSPQGVVERALRTLRRMFGRAVPEPAATWVTRWAADPFAGGSYSHLPPGLDGSTYDALAEPVGGRLFFAGEHTHRAHPATTHGAYLSGLRAAREVMASGGTRRG